MRIGAPKEIKNKEYRVALTPAGCGELVREGHEVMIESNAGAAIGFADDNYTAAGCKIAADTNSLFEFCELIVKVKEPQPQEVAKLRPDQLLFTYLHLAANPTLTAGLLASGATCIAYETVTDARGRLPLLTPMSEVAGRLSIQAGAAHLENGKGGAGVLLGGVTGVRPARVVIIGGGVAGFNAAQMAIGLGADTTILDRSIDRLRELNAFFGDRVKAIYSTDAAIADEVVNADLVVGAVLLPGAAAPKVVRRDLIARMKTGTVVVDIAIDQGGCFETSRPTSHDDPTFVVDGVVHYCVTNMPAAVSRTSTEALSNVTLPFVKQLARLGVDQACQDNSHLAAGVNLRNGEIIHRAVREAYAASTISVGDPD